MIQYSLYPIFIAKLDITYKWVSGKISNLEYLLKLNFLGGRTYKCPQLYPIMPNILTNFKGDLNDKSSYRDFRTQKFYAIRPLNWLQTFHNFENVIGNKYSAPCSSDSTSLHILNDSNTDISEVSNDARIEDDDSTSGCPTITITDTVELTPEFFYEPDCFPTFGQELVKKLRMALESPFISSQLNFWIDQVFGISQPQNFKVAQIFTTPHPARITAKYSVEERTDYVTTIPVNKITCASFDFSNSIIVRGIAKDVGLFEWKNGELKIIAKNANRMTFVPYKGGCALVNNQDAGLTLYGSDQFFISPAHEAHYFGTGSKYGVCCGRGGLAYCIDGNRKIVFGVCHVSPESPCCICSSSEFRLTVVGTKSGALMLFDLSRGLYIRTINLNAEPKSVLVTKCIGKIVVFSASDVTVISLTGTILVSKSHEELFGKGTTPVCSCSIPQSIFLPDDSIVVCDSKKHIYIIDTSNLSIFGNSPFAECHSSPVCVRCYSRVFSSCVIYTLSDDAHITVSHIPSLKE
jgi:hypothetical protein